MDRIIGVLLLLLIGGSLYSATLSYRFRPGIDFYQYWGVGMAHKVSGGVLSSPYVNLERYDSILDSVTAISNDRRLSIANSANHNSYKKYSLEMNATPLTYAVFALMPQNYSFSYGIFLGMRVILFLVALYLLCPPQTVSIPVLLSGILLVAYYQPMASDARVGNLGMVQLFSAVALSYCCRFYLNRLSPARVLLPLIAVLSSLVFLVLLKPTFSLIAVAITASLVSLLGIKKPAQAGIAACIFAIILFIIPCIFFNSWTIWKDWLDYLAPGNGKITSYSIAAGNFSTANLISKSCGIPINYVVTALALLLILSIILAIINTSNIKTTVCTVLSNTYLTASMAIIATLALSPLVWFHYYMLTLLPALWMINISSGLNIFRILGILSLLLSSGIIDQIPGISAYLPYIFASSWVPLWIASLIMISSAKNTFENQTESTHTEMVHT